MDTTHEAPQSPSATTAASASIQQLRNLQPILRSKRPDAPIERTTLPQISASRLTALSHDLVRDDKSRGDGKVPGTKLYLAYGSNLCYETFQGRRGIRPLAQLNVVVPSLRMTFDLPGIPYTEPCFANSGLRGASPPSSITLSEGQDPEKGELHIKEDYHKDRWRKGMVGVVYEVTPEDYAHIIATEGGGSGYQDVLVDCYPLVPGSDVVPDFPGTEAFKAHTLFAPEPEDGSGRAKRPDPSYAQPSARYLKLITDGAEEHDFPKDYMDYLYDIRPYEARTKETKMGVFVAETLFRPWMLFLLSLLQRFQDKDGRAPAWLTQMMGVLFLVTWKTYDGCFKKVFGDGERTDYCAKKPDEAERKGWRRVAPQRDEEWAEKV